MVSRVERLEVEVERLRSRVMRLEERLSRLEERLTVSRSDWSPVKEVKGDA